MSKATDRRYREKHPERRKANFDNWAARNKEWIKEYKHKWNKENPRNRIEEQRARKEKKATRPRPKNCECCGVAEEKTGRCLNFDHDHNTGKFRGWLCWECNVALGKLGDTREGVQRMLVYLENAELLS